MELTQAADYFDIVRIGEPAVAPDGQTIAFVRKKPDDDETDGATIYVTTTDGEDTRQFTATDGIDSQPSFSPSGERLAFVSTRDADDDPPQLWVMPTDGGEARQVTSVPGGVGEITWRPDGHALAFSQKSTAREREEGYDLAAPEEYEREPPDPRVIDRTVYRSEQEYFDGRRSHVYVVTLNDAGDWGEDATPDVSRLTDGERDFFGPTWAGDRSLYYGVRAGEPDPDDSLEYDIVGHDLDSGETTTVHTSTTWMPTLEATADGRVAFTYTDPDRATLRPTRVRVLDVESGTVERPMAELDRTLAVATPPQWGPDERQLYFLTGDDGAVALWTVEWDGNRPERVFRRAGTSLDGFDVGDSRIALVASEWDHPGDLYVSTLTGEEPVRLTRVNEPLLSERQVAEPEEIRYEVDGTELQGWILTPPTFDPEKTYPLLVEIHGGPHAMWTTSGTMWHEFQTLAARGYVVFWSNPRGSAGYGEDHMAAIDGNWGEVTMKDVIAGVDRVCERDYVDENQLFVTGGSFGGFMTAWIVGQTDRFEAAVAQRGVYDLTGFYGSTDLAYRLVEDDFDAVPWEDATYLWEHSPVGHAHEVETPTLLIHSDRDFRTPDCTAELYYRILRKHGVDTRLVRYPREGHELSRSGEPYHVVDRIERIARWFDGYSDRHDVPPALERDSGSGLTGPTVDDEDSSAE